MRKFLLLFVTFFVLCLGDLLAQAPLGFNYQAVARDAGGAPMADTPIGLRFTLWQNAPDSANASRSFIKFYKVTTNSLGLFSLKINMDEVLGEQAVLYGDLLGIPWGQHDFYLQVDMDTDGGNDCNSIDPTIPNCPLMGAQQLLSVPYALYAASAGSTTNSLWEKWGDNVVNLEENIGIGTLNPIGKLSLVGDTLNDLILKTSDNSKSQGLAFQNSADSYTWNIFRKQAGTFTADLVFAGNGGEAESDITALNPYVTFKAGGRVGIGNGAPKAGLHLEAPSINSKGQLVLVDSDFPSDTAACDVSISAWGNNIDGGNTGRTWYLGDASNSNMDITLFSELDGDFKFGTNGSNTNLVIDRGGNVGVGTSSPVGKLTIVGDTLNDLTIKTTDNDYSQGIAFQNSGNAYTWNIFRKMSSDNTVDLTFAGNETVQNDITALSPHVTFKAGGNVGFGTENPVSKFTIQNDSANTITLKNRLSNNVNNGIAFQNTADSYTWNIFRRPSGTYTADLVIAGHDTTPMTNPADLDPYLTVKSGGDVEVSEGDVYVKDATKGIILVDSVTGDCYRVRMVNGVLVSEVLGSCP